MRKPGRVQKVASCQRTERESRLHLRERLPCLGGKREESDLFQNSSASGACGWRRSTGGVERRARGKESVRGTWSGCGGRGVAFRALAVPRLVYLSSLVSRPLAFSSPQPRFESARQFQGPGATTANAAALLRVQAGERGGSPAAITAWRMRAVCGAPRCPGAPRREWSRTWAG